MKKLSLSLKVENPRQFHDNTLHNSITNKVATFVFASISSIIASAILPFP